MENQYNNIAVVYLAWIPYGTSFFERFLESYKLNDAGADHDLVILFNGLSVQSDSKLDDFEQILDESGIQNSKKLYFEKGLDILIYKKAAKLLDYKYLLFLNSYSKILHPGWLKLYTSNWDAQTGVIGATGSHAGYVRSIQRQWIFNLFNKTRFLKLYRDAIYLVKISLLYRNEFGKFPNPHVRTNAFMVERERFINLQFGKLNTKHDAYYFENGKNSMTNQLIQLGYICKVIDKIGKSWNIADCKESKTFWINEQEMLLISDNQTDSYQFADSKMRLKLRKDSWGY